MSRCELSVQSGLACLCILGTFYLGAYFHPAQCFVIFSYSMSFLCVVWAALRARLSKARRNIQTQKRSESKSNNMGCASTKPSTAVSFDDVKLVTGTPIEGAPHSAASAEAALLKAEIDAANRLQAEAGAATRLQAEARRHPCDSYCVNMKATDFGTCTCGHPKAMHSEAAMEAAAETKQQTIFSPGTVMKRFVQKERAECTKYVVNMTSINFGECQCGRGKVDHTPAALAAADTSNAANLTSPGTLQAKFVRKEKVECDRYSVDLTAARTAQCHCGSLRTEHSAAALAAGDKAKAANVDAEALRKTFVQRDKAECVQFKVNLATGGFGECQNCDARPVKYATSGSVQSRQAPAPASARKRCARASRASNSRVGKPRAGARRRILS